MKHAIYITILCLLGAATGISQSNASAPCAALAVRLTAPSSQGNQLYGIAYCNQGTDIATNSYIDIELGGNVTIRQATAPLVARQDNVYRFSIGDVAAGECGSIYVEIPRHLRTTPCLSIYAIHGNSCDGQQASNGMVTRDDMGNGDGNTGTGTGTGTASGNGILGTYSMAFDVASDIDPIFEDHVFLDIVPTWDSLLVVLGGAMSYNADQPNGNQTGSLDFGEIDYGTLPVYAVDHDCSTDVTNDTRTGTIVNVPQTNRAAATTWYWAGQPLVQQSQLILEGQSYQRICLTLIDATGRQIAVLQSTTSTLTLDRSALNLSSGVYYYSLEGDNQRLGTGVLAVQ